MYFQVTEVRFSLFYICARTSAFRFKVAFPVILCHSEGFSGCNLTHSKLGTNNYKLSQLLIMHELAYTVPHSIRKSPLCTFPS